MERCDVAVIGGGLLGCFAARELTRYALRVVLIEQREDVCTGISKANTAIVYPGYDNRPGSLKAELTVRANSGFDALCRELEVPFSRCGSLMLSYGGRADMVLREKLENGRRNGVPGLRLISGEEALELEPGLRPGVRHALYATSPGTVNPWRLCFAAFENAVHNGCTALLDTALLGIRRDGADYMLQTARGDIPARAVVNCAGLNADKVRELLFSPSVRIFPDGADYLVMARSSASLRHIILHETETGGKGLTAVPSVDGNVLLGPSERPCGESPSATETGGLAFVSDLAREIFPWYEPDGVIRSFAATRPKPIRVVPRGGGYVTEGTGISDFVIDAPEPRFLSFIGVKTPGLTCAGQLGALSAKRIAASLGAGLSADFDPERKAPKEVRALSFEQRAALATDAPDFGDIVCQCEDVSRGEILEAIRRGAVTVDGVKRRCGAGMGLCQGSRCQQRVAELLAQQLGIPIEKVTKNGGSSFIAGDRHG